MLCEEVFTCIIFLRLNTTCGLQELKKNPSGSYLLLKQADRRQKLFFSHWIYKNMLKIRLTSLNCEYFVEIELKLLFI